MIAIWDDHEFSDDCWQDAETYDLGTYDATTGAATTPTRPAAACTPTGPGSSSCRPM
jgi:phosphodiesterase/alkaline phosphatase D-like protein